MHEIFWYVERENVKSFEAFDLIKQMFNECWILKIDSCWDKIIVLTWMGVSRLGIKDENSHNWMFSSLLCVFLGAFFGVWKRMRNCWIN